MKPGKVGGARASKVGALGFTLLALVLTLLTAFLLAQMIGGSQYAGEPVKEIVVAAKTIEPSERITEDHLKMVKWPASSVPDGAFTSVDQILGPNSRVPVNTILTNEVLVEEKLASAATGTGMAGLVPRNYRAFPIPVDRWFADAKLVYPGAVVDIMTTIQNVAERKVSTKMVLQRVRVLAVNGAVDVVGQAAKEDQNNRPGATGNERAVVTLLVTPEQAEALALASREGKIDLTLRNTGDEGLVETFGMTPLELLGQADPEELEALLEAQKAALAAMAESKEVRRRVRRRAPPPELPPPVGANDPNYPPDDRPASMGGGGSRAKTIRLEVK